eukprot:767330-Hanusia_phi.AAC.7
MCLPSLLNPEKEFEFQLLRSCTREPSASESQHFVVAWVQKYKQMLTDLGKEIEGEGREAGRKGGGEAGSGEERQGGRRRGREGGGAEGRGT